MNPEAIGKNRALLFGMMKVDVAMLRHKIQRTIWPCLAALVCAVSGLGQVAVQFKDFSALGSDRAGKRSVLKGSDARQAANGMLEILNAHVDLFNADNSLDLTIETPQCLYQNTTKVASSSRELSVKTGDGRLTLQGVGFSWQQNNSSLVVSNSVRAVLQRGAFSKEMLGQGKTRTTSTASSPLHVTASRLEYAGDTVIFRGRVHVNDEISSLDCEVLRLQLGQGETRLKKVEAEQNVVMQQGQTKAAGARASYDLSVGLLRLDEGVTWQLGARSGKSAWVQVNRTNNTVLAGGSVHMVLPAAGFMQGVATNAAKKKTSLEIDSENFEYRESGGTSKNTTALFTGRVKARETESSLTSERLTIEFQGTNELRRVFAEGGTELIRGRDRITGQKVVYEVATEEVTVTGQPAWKFENKQGRSQIVKFNTRTRSIKAENNVELEMPTDGNFTAQLLPGRSGTNSVPTNHVSIVKVKADQFYFNENTGTFDKNVQVTDAKGVLRCGKLQLITGTSNQLQQLRASIDVILIQEASTATGQLAVYTATNGILTLTGSPKIFTATQQVTAEEFHVNRLQGTFAAKGPYKIQVSKAGMKKPSPSNSVKEKISP